MKKFFINLLKRLKGKGGTAKSELPLNKKEENEAGFIHSIQFDQPIIHLLRAHTAAPFSRFKTELEEWFMGEDSKPDARIVVNNTNGLIFEMKKNKAIEMVYKLKNELKAQGYIIFIAESNHFSLSLDKVAVLKTDDQFEILSIQGTNAANYNLETVDIVNKLKEWNEDYPFEIVGCGFDWVEAKFIKPPIDMLKFAKEVYAFCPDVVDQGTETVEKLAEDMIKDNSLFLWWD